MLYKVDFHVHSNRSEDGTQTAPTIEKYAKKYGISAVAVCDHNEPPLDYCGDEVLFIPGSEITTASGHVLALFCTKDLPTRIYKDTCELSETIDEIHKCGGIAVLSHPFAPQKMTFVNLCLSPLDGYEICNSRAALREGANENAAKLANITKRKTFGGSDAHTKYEIGGAYCEIECDKLDSESIKAAVINGKCHAVLSRKSKWRYKGISRLTKDLKSKNILEIAKGAAYLVAGFFRDIIGK
ncbi:MAG: PHP domain-containing protein [Clostridia bacterium]|nr:PHP domain-containing protein [Clostridia bacterium]